MWPVTLPDAARRCRKTLRGDTGLCSLAAQAQADRAGLWLGEDGRAHSPSDGARHRAGRSGVRAEHGRLQPGAHANAGEDVS